MPLIHLETFIHASSQVCFNLSRSIDLHIRTQASRSEKAVAGRTAGLIGYGESVTWEARHFGLRWTLTTRITTFQPYNFFVDEMSEGVFRSLRHEHIFEEKDGVTRMTDNFFYESPAGIFGKFADKVFLKHYLTRLLTNRNLYIKEVAEAESEVGNFIKD